MRPARQALELGDVPGAERAVEALSIAFGRRDDHKDLLDRAVTRLLGLGVVGDTPAWEIAEKLKAAGPFHLKNPS